MTVKSYRRERVAELKAGLARKNREGAKVVELAAKKWCPEQTGLLKKAIRSNVRNDEGFDVGFSGVKYGKFVHNGTYDFNHGMGEWSEAEAQEILAWKSAQQRRGGSKVVTPPKGLMPRPFLVYALVVSKGALSRIYGTQIRGG